MFSEHHRVDFGIDSILEGQSGKQIYVVVDDVANPTVALLRYGTFGVLGGDVMHTNAHALGTIYSPTLRHSTFTGSMDEPVTYKLC